MRLVGRCPWTCFTTVGMCAILALVRQPVLVLRVASGWNPKRCLRSLFGDHSVSSVLVREVRGECFVPCTSSSGVWVPALCSPCTVSL